TVTGMVWLRLLLRAGEGQRWPAAGCGAFGGPPVARPAETGQPSQYPRCDPATSAHMQADARRGPGVGPAGVVDGRGARGTTGRHNATPVARQERAPADGRFTTRDTPGRGGRCPSLTR